MKRIAVALAAITGLLFGAYMLADAATPTTLIRTNNSGGSPLTINEIPGTPCWRNGNQTYRPSNVAFSACTPTTSTTIPATTTTRPATTTTTVAATTTAPTTSTTTTPPTSSTSTSSTLPATTTTIPGSGDFVETFTGNTGFDRFVHGVYHRDNVAIRQTQWSGDHDLACGPPDTQRIVHRSNPEESFWTCADHMMTSMGDTSGYSLVWFKPNQTFSRADTRSVSWDVSVTDLLARKWWEVAVLPVGDPDEVCSPAFSPDPCGLPTWSDSAVVAGLDHLWVGSTDHDLWGIGNYCFGGWQADPAGCASKVIRRHFVLTDNGNGTVTLEMPDLGAAWTYPGSFPSQFKVVFKDHNYTPLKDGTPVGLTWHIDNFVVR